MIDRSPVPAARSPHVSKPQLTVLRPEHVRALLAATAGSTWEVPLRMAAMTGMRRSEIVALAWDAVDLEAGTLAVRRSLHLRPRSADEPDDRDRFYFEEPKSEAGYRTIRLAPSLVELLRRHRTAQAKRRLAAGDQWHDGGLVLDRGDGHPMDPDLLSAAAKRYFERAGLPAGARLHDLRHAAAVLLRMEGVPIIAVAEMLGHSTPAFTISQYEHTVSEMQVASAEALERRLG